MRRTIHQQISANTRLSIVYGVMVILLLAALGGAIVGYYAPEFFVVGIVGSAALGLIVALVAWNSGSDIVLKMNQARDATPHELQVVNNVTEEMAIAAGIPTPHVYVIDDPSPNAFATGRGPKKGIVAVTTGLLARLDREELQGVIAHEVGHIRNNDIKFMTTLAIVVGLIPMVSHFFLRSLWHTGGGRRRGGDGGGQGQVVFFVIALVLAVLAPLFARLLELAVSRRREFMADASAAQFTRNPEGLASALEKIAGSGLKMEAANKATEHMYIINPFQALEARGIFSTHPPTHERIAALRGLSGLDYRRYLGQEEP
ncbi:MAG: M48 family metallopeptidase [Fimbriimonadaceae bacterium]